MRDLLKMLLRKKLEKRASLLNEKMAKQKSCIQCGHLFRFFNKKWHPSNRYISLTYINTENLPSTVF
jgi:hypothetical protein